MNNKPLQNTSYETALFYVLLVLHLIPLFTGLYFPTSDGVAHLYNADLMKDMLLGRAIVPLEFLEWNLHPDPNRFSHYVLVALMLFLPDFVAEKVLLASYLIFFPLGLRYLLKSLNHNAAFLAVFGFPMAYSLSFWFGFYNFCFSLVFFFYFVGYWLRIRYQYNVLRLTVLILLTVCLYFTHPVSYLFSIAFLGLWIISESYQNNQAFLSPYRANIKSWTIQHINWSFLFRQAGIMVLVYGLTGALLLIYIFRIGASTYYYPVSWWGQASKLIRLAPLEFLGVDEALVLGLFSSALFTLLIVSILNYQRVNIFRYSTVLSLLVGLGLYYLFGPDGAAGGSALYPRIGLLFYIFIVLFAGLVNWKPKAQRIIFYPVAVLSLVLLGIRTNEYRQIQRVLDEIMTAQPYIPDNAITLPYCFYPVDLSLAHNFPAAYHPLKHYSNYLLLGKTAVSLDNYEARTSYFPLNWQTQKIADPVQLNHLNDVVSVGDKIPLVRFHDDIIGQRVQYVLLAGVHTVADKTPHTALFNELESEFDLVYESKNKIIHVYRRQEGDVPVVMLAEPADTIWQ